MLWASENIIPVPQNSSFIKCLWKQETKTGMWPDLKLGEVLVK